MIRSSAVTIAVVVLFAVGVFAQSQVAASTQRRFIACPSGWDGVSLSSSSGSGRAVVGVLPCNAPVTVLSDNQKWAKVQHDTLTGFVQTGYLSATAPVQQAPVQTGKGGSVVAPAARQSQSSVPLAAARASVQPNVLTDASVLQMLKSGLSADIVAAKIKVSPTSFDTSPAALDELKAAGVPDTLILAMIGAPAGPSAATAVANAGPAPAHFGLLDGTPVKLKLMENMSSHDATVGQEVPFEVVDPVMVDGVTVIQNGANAVGTVTLAKRKGHLGRGGKLNINIDFVMLADGEKAMLRAVKDTNGGGHGAVMTGAIVATSLVFFPAAPLFLFMHGKDINIPEGTEITAFINGDHPLNWARLVAANRE